MSEEMRHALPKGYEIEGYRIEKVLGAGGFGVTYLAHEIAINRRVAIKEYLPSGIAARGRDDVSVHPLSAADRENFQWGLDRFRKEAQTLVTFRHNNIVTVYRYFEANGTAFLVMAYEDGESLAKILERAGTLTEEEINDLLGPLLDGLAHVHSVGFLHRDIKPGNIYIRRDGSPVLLDFGAARQALGGRSQSLTSIVSAGYAPFEQYTTRGNQGAWTDIYALGGVLYRATTGERPPDSPDRIRDDPYVPAVQAAAGKYSETLLAAIDAALAVDEAHRPQSVTDWRALFAGGQLPARAAQAGPDGATLRPGQGASAQLPTGKPIAPKPGQTAATAAAAMTQAPKQKRGMLAAAVIAGGILVLGAAGAGAYFYLDSQGETQAAGFIGKARSAITAGALDEAERLIADAEKAKKDHPDLDKIKAELQAARVAEQGKIRQAGTLLGQARSAILRRDFATAERLIEQAAQLAPNHPDLTAVREALRAAKENATTDQQVRALLGRAREAIARRAWDEAERLIAEAAKLSPNHAELASAREELRRAKESGERTAQVQRLLAQARDAIRAKNFTEAERLIAELARLVPAGDRDLATIRSELETAKRGSPPDTNALDRLLEEARDAILRKDFETARRKLDEAARISPADAGLAQLRKQLADAEAKERPANGTDYSKVTKTPNNLCQPGTQRMVEATRKLTLPPARYCTDADWSVRNVRAEGANLLWRVPFTDGHVDCACVRGTGGTTTVPGTRTPVPGVTKSPMTMCQPGSMRYVDATRQLALPGARYCTTPNWNVRNAETDGVSLYWRVIFSDGHVNCQCTRSSADASPATPSTELTAVPGVTKTPNNLCVAGTQRMVRTTRKLTLPSQRYCTDSDWGVADVKTDGTTLFWNVPFTEGVVACSCRKR